MLNIVHIMLTGPVTDGWNYQDNLLTKYHRRMGYEVTMITSQWVWGKNGELAKCEKTNYYNDDSVKVIRLPIIGNDNWFRKFKRFKGLYENIYKENPDILFIHGVSFVDIDTIKKYIKLRKDDIRVFVDNHSDFSNSGTNWLSKNILHKIVWKSYVKRIQHYVQKFYGVLPARVDWLINMYGIPKYKCELLFMGADDDRIDEAIRNNARDIIRKKYNVGTNDFLVVTGGKIDNAKKQTLLLMKAISELYNQNVKLLVFGSVAKELKNQVDNLVDNKKIYYAGWADAQQSYDYFMAADLVVFPGRHSVYWEQVVAMGIPMVCKYWEGTTHIDIGGNVKYLYNDTDDEIKELLLSILSNLDEYNIMLNNAHKKEKELFSYLSIAKKSIGQEF